VRIRAPFAAVLAPGALAIALLVGGCGSLDLPSSAPSAGASAGLALATATAEAPPSFGPPPVATPDDAAPVVIDDALLALLPASVGEAPVTEDVDAAAQAVNDPALDKIASAVDAGVAVDLGNGDLVYALIVQLKPGAFGEELFRQWRDSYDEGACVQSGGVVGHAEAEIGGRKTYVTSCVQGMHTYHLWLADQNLLISASAIGEGRFGEELLKGLRLA
jgi:hypothetical protein